MEFCGALTTYDFAFRGRSWEVQRKVSVGITNSEGSLLNLQIRGAEILRVLPYFSSVSESRWLDDYSRYYYTQLHTGILSGKSQTVFMENVKFGVLKCSISQIKNFFKLNILSLKYCTSQDIFFFLSKGFGYDKLHTNLKVGINKITSLLLLSKIKHYFCFIGVGLRVETCSYNSLKLVIREQNNKLLDTAYETTVCPIVSFIRNYGIKLPNMLLSTAGSNDKLIQCICNDIGIFTHKNAVNYFFSVQKVLEMLNFKSFGSFLFNKRGLSVFFDSQMGHFYVSLFSNNIKINYAFWSIGDFYMALGNFFNGFKTEIMGGNDSLIINLIDETRSVQQTYSETILGLDTAFRNVRQVNSFGSTVSLEGLVVVYKLNVGLLGDELVWDIAGRYHYDPFFNYLEFKNYEDGFDINHQLVYFGHNIYMCDLCQNI